MNTDAFTWTDPDAAVHRAGAPLWINAGCGTHRAPLPWINTDLVHNHDTRPDIIVTADDPLPFPIQSAGRIMLGHVLEHITLDDIPTFLAEVRAALVHGGRVLVTGPDVYRTIHRWRGGLEPWDLVQSVLEHAAYPGTTDWPGALHHWNCHEARVVEMLELAGFVDVTALPVPPVDEGWPVVCWSDWQCCVSAVRP